MKRPLLLMTTLCMLAVTPAAWAEEVPPGGRYDLRVREVVYNDRQVFRLNATLRSALQIQFSEGETVDNIALGDSVTWEVAPSAHFVFVKPRDAAKPTNMIVTTRRGNGQVRVYHFELSAAAGSVEQRSGTMFAVVFRYPDAERQAAENARQNALRQQALEVEAGAVTTALDGAIVTGPRNLSYSLAGPREIAPSEVSDNGIATVLRFPRGQAVPAIYKVMPDGSEALVAFDVRGEFIIIHEVVGELRLRLGNSVVSIWNDRPGPQVGDVSTGTISPDVIRELEPAQ